MRHCYHHLRVQRGCLRTELRVVPGENGAGDRVPGPEDADRHGTYQSVLLAVLRDSEWTSAGERVQPDAVRQHRAVGVDRQLESGHGVRAGQPERKRDQEHQGQSLQRHLHVHGLHPHFQAQRHHQPDHIVIRVGPKDHQRGCQEHIHVHYQHPHDVEDVCEGRVRVRKPYLQEV